MGAGAGYVGSPCLCPISGGQKCGHAPLSSGLPTLCHRCPHILRHLHHRCCQIFRWGLQSSWRKWLPYPLVEIPNSVLSLMPQNFPLGTHFYSGTWTDPAPAPLVPVWVSAISVQLEIYSALSSGSCSPGSQPISPICHNTEGLCQQSSLLFAYTWSPYL